MITLGQLVDDLYADHSRNADTVHMEKEGVSCATTYSQSGETLKIIFYYGDILIIITHTLSDAKIMILRNEYMKHKELLLLCQLDSVREIPFSTFTNPQVKSARK